MKHMKWKPPKVHTMDLILAVIFVVLVAFSVEMIVIFKETGYIPDTLCTCVFASLGGECGAMAWIKTAKERNQDRRNELDDRKYLDEKEEKERERNSDLQ